MKSFKQWIVENTPSNVSAGIGIRGLGDVTGNPTGDISAYAAANAATPPAAQAMVDQHNALHNGTMNTSDNVMGYDGGDTKDQILNPKAKKK